MKINIVAAFWHFKNSLSSLTTQMIICIKRRANNHNDHFAHF